MPLTPAKLTVSELAKLTANLDEPSFVARYPLPALIVATLAAQQKWAETPTSGLKTETSLDRTSTFRVLPKSLTETSEDEDEPTAAPLGLGAKSDVLFLLKSDRNPFANMVTLGRAPNNDLIVASTR